jgi:protein-L-isoaspartate(D-aspartate) O-methyltransferase
VLSIADCRQFYAEEIRFAANLNSPALVAAFARVPREKYLGSSPWQIGSPQLRMMAMSSLGSMAYRPTHDPRDLYHNVVVALDPEREINNGQPSALACWIEALDLKPGDRAYHLGCGVGYYTAIIAEVVGEPGSVVGIDVNADLVPRARQNLADYPNVSVHAADGATFNPGECDAMLINAGVTHPLPVWLDHLREGGRLVLPLTMAASPTLGAGIMAKITRRAGAFSAAIVSPVGIFSCTSGRDPQLEPLLRQAISTRTVMQLKSVRRDEHGPEDSCIVHCPGACLSSEDPVVSPRLSNNL